VSNSATTHQRSPLKTTSAYVELPQSVLAPQTGPGAPPTAAPSTSPNAPGPAGGLINRDKKKKHNLSSSTDPLFDELRDLNFSAVGKKLNRVAHRLEEDYKVCGMRNTSPVYYANDFSLLVAPASSQDRRTTEGLCWEAGRAAK
jgi:hypothetical protein